MGAEHRAPLRPARHGRSEAGREAGMGRRWAPGICAMALLWLAAAAAEDPDPDELERAYLMPLGQKMMASSSFQLSLYCVGFFVMIWIATVMFKSNDILRKQTALKILVRQAAMVVKCVLPRKIDI
ncbi:uncharacterized protein LOC125553813 isoform X2 [Triticum urartu]|uniref:uncharacterized protein LOC125553813 isoform X2 n=1 Tax=Triticum urartu TaxID=4572 RepID=UPI0020436C36|nr:uncharacterized protein LOC125553813 isoform X2 [Triticum urartu]